MTPKNDSNTINYLHTTGLPQGGIPYTVSTTGINSYANLGRKLINIMKNTHSVKKSGYNAHHKYQYSTEADMIETIRDLLIQNNVLVTSSVKSISKDGDVTSIITEHTFLDVDSGETLTVQGAGQGQDKGDKGVFKAITGAMKYFISKNFLIAGEDDPENDGANPSYVRNNDAATTVPTSAKKFNRPTITPATESKPEVKPQAKTETKTEPTTTTKKFSRTTPIDSSSASKPSFSRPQNPEPDYEEDI